MSCSTSISGRIRAGIVATVASSIGGIACGEPARNDDARQDAGAPGVCEPGRQIACTCDGGGVGFQVCGDGGWGTCLGCERPDGGAPDGSDAAPETGTDAAAHPDDDPCPAEPPFVNCSSTCTGATPGCDVGPGALGTCRTEYTELEVTDPSLLPLVIRTPSNPGVDPGCVAVCGTGSTVWGISISLIMPSTLLPDGGWGTDHAFRVSVAPPWRIIETPGYSLYCEWTFAFDECRVHPYEIATFQIVTTDPNAPARNVLIEWVPKPAECP